MRCGFLKRLSVTLYSAARHLLRRRPEASARPIQRPLPFGFLDAVEIEPCGLVRVHGWVLPEHKDARPALVLEAAGKTVPLLDFFRTFRQDVALLYGGGDPFVGRVWSFLIPPGGKGGVSSLRLLYEGEAVWTLEQPVPLVTPHYAGLFNDSRVHHRENIYGCGPPASVVAYEVLALARALPGPLLDFGCGAGTLVQALRVEGKEAYGIEMRRPEIEAHLIEEAKPHVTLYDGAFPLPYADGQFASVTAVEVVEHITEYQEAVRELARVCREKCLITVPDMSAVPTLFPHGAVPWHLLEGTHYNFFNQTSLEALLKLHFRTVAFARIGENRVNGTRVYTSLAALCMK